MASAALPGFRDFYPRELAERAHIMRAWRDVARRYAFVEYDGPPLEPLELYTKKSGDEIVGQLYAFADKGGRQVALRPEMTPTFARMVGARANALRKPVRWFSMPQLFRYERQQKGRLREHFQLNVDIVGASGIAADAELIACAIDVMRELGLTSADVVARVSDRRVLEAYLRALGVPGDALAGAYAVIDKIERQPRDVSAAKLAAAGVPAGAVEAILDIASVTLEELEERLGSGPAAPLVRDLRLLHTYVPALLGGDEGWLRLDLSIVRGLAYYTGMVFELFDRTGEFRAICGGGRYDNLLASLGGADLPALGFGMGDVVLGELLRARGLMPDVEPRIDRWVLAEEEVPMERVMAEAARLRAAGCSVEYALEARSLSKQKKAAQSSGATEFVTVSNTPRSNG
ncbi:MAG TPA: histidine--tRNA ligase [Gemmatimonadaceae bacterium]|nr:histidine--tRNA ligase [Gemmatimonadaceae bacterium]